MDLFATLEKKQRFTYFNSGRENRFFLSHSALLNSLPSMRRFSRMTKPFDVIRANIVIRSVINKKKIDETYIFTARNFRREGELRHDGEIAIRKAVTEVQKDLPYLLLESGERIFVPILPKSLNTVYDTALIRFEDKPYKEVQGNDYDMLIIDPFDAYGIEILDSPFTNLICLRKVEGKGAFFDYDSLSIYFVDDQGRLENACCLFDRALPNRNTNHMLDRITPVVDAYYRDDREAMYKALVNNQLVSSRLIDKIKFDEERILFKIKTKVNK